MKYFRAFSKLPYAVVAFAAMLPAGAWPDVGWAIDRAEAVKYGRQYLACNNDAERERLAAKLAEYEGEIQPVIDELSRRSYVPVKAGYHPGEHFASANLRDKRRGDWGLVYPIKVELDVRR